MKLKMEMLNWRSENGRRSQMQRNDDDDEKTEGRQSEYEVFEEKIGRDVGL